MTSSKGYWFLLFGLFMAGLPAAQAGVIQLRRPWQNGDFWKPETYPDHQKPNCNSLADGKNLAVDFYATSTNRPDLFRGNSAGESGHPIYAANNGGIFLHLFNLTNTLSGNVEAFDALAVINGGPVPKHSFSISDVSGNPVVIDMEMVVNTSAYRTVYVHLQPLSSYFTPDVEAQIRAKVGRYYYQETTGNAAIDTGSLATAGLTQLGTTDMWGHAGQPHLHFLVFKSVNGYSQNQPALGCVVDLSDPGQVTVDGQAPIDWSLEATVPGTSAFQFTAMPRRRFAVNDAIVVHSAWDNGRQSVEVSATPAKCGAQWAGQPPWPPDQRLFRSRDDDGLWHEHRRAASWN